MKVWVVWTLVLQKTMESDENDEKSTVKTRGQRRPICEQLCELGILSKVKWPPGLGVIYIYSG